MKSQDFQFPPEDSATLPIRRIHRNQDITQVGLLSHGESEHVRRFGYAPIAPIVEPDSPVADQDGREFGRHFQSAGQPVQELFKMPGLDRELVLPIEYVDVGLVFRQFAC